MSGPAMLGVHGSPPVLAACSHHLYDGLVIFIRRNPRQVMLSGSEAELLVLSDKISELLGSKELSFSADADTGRDPKPYPEALSQLIVQKSEDLIHIGVSPDRALLVNGAPRHLEVFNENLRNLALTPSWHAPNHMHVMYYEGNPILSPDSTELILFCEAS